jgi:hypothetical protein
MIQVGVTTFGLRRFARQKSSMAFVWTKLRLLIARILAESAVSTFNALSSFYRLLFIHIIKLNFKKNRFKK